MAKQAPKKKGANGYKLPERLPKGEILKTLNKIDYILGDSIGMGGFGEIYSAADKESNKTNYQYVVKIEPHENGPLFVEINFYLRNCRPMEVETYRDMKNWRDLAIPYYIGSGSHEYKGQKYRFLIMHRFGQDIWKLFLENDRIFPTPTVCKIAIKMLHALEYIHDHGYVHADLKGSNILTGYFKKTVDHLVLVDFGLACKYHTGGEFKPNPKKAHDGTIEYLSRDAHKGVPTRRGDLEILAYNIIQWLGCTLPWESDLSNPTKVQESKEKHMSDPGKFLKKCLGSRCVPVCLTEFIKYINEMSFDEEPNYKKIEGMFLKEIEKYGDNINSPLVYKQDRQTSPKRKSEPEEKSNKRQKKNEDETKAVEEKKTKKEIVKKTKVKTPKSKTTEEPAVVDEFDGYTPEMKALALKKLENGGKKTASKAKKPPKENSAKKISPKKTDKDPGPSVTSRSRRNLKAVNYNDNGSS